MYDFNENKLSLDDEGIIISDKQANELNVGVEDFITINDKSVKISSISKQIYNFRVIMSYKLFNKLYGYNIANFLFTNEEPESLKTEKI